MTTMYLPTIDWPLWPCLVLLAVFIPVSIWHETHWRRTLAEYARVRRSAGASDEEWPSSELRWVLSLQPWLLFIVALMLTAMVVLGAAALIAWPRRLPGFDQVINYYDRPYLTAMLVAGVAAVAGTMTLALDLWRSPWRRAAARIRRAVHAPALKREESLSAALKVDPGVPPS